MAEEYPEAQQPANPQQFEEEDAISLIDLLVVFAKHKKKILLMPLLVGGIVAGYSLIVPEIFTAQTTLIPSDQKQSSAMAMLNQLGPLAGLASGSGGGSQTEVLMTMLKSRRIQDKIIAKHNLQNVDEKSIPMWEAQKNLSEVTAVSVGRKDGVITVSVEDESPEKAAEMANDYIRELESLSQELALTVASQRRVFLEKQMINAFANLQDAEEGLKSSQEKSGLIQLDAQGKAIIEGIAQLQAKIAAEEVALGALRLSSTDENPEVQRLLAAIQQMGTQLDRMEQGQPSQLATNSVMLSTSNVPAAGLEYLRRLRKLKYAETIHQLLAQQYQMAKVDEARDAPLLQVLDAAIAPEKRSSPKRTQMVLMAVVASGFAMCLLAFLLEAKRQAEDDPEQAGKMAGLRQSLWKF
jgi:tyrosine-protein kinase Etk/Wzc